MHDQANDLRRLVRESRTPASAPAAPRPTLLVVAGGKGGVGTTTLAVNLAVALAQRGRRTVLVDADPDTADAAILCRLPEHHTVADVLASRRSIAEALQPGPGGIRVLAGAWGLGTVWDCPPAAQQQLVEQLGGPDMPAELVVVDAGNSPGRMAKRFWQAADAVLLVTTPELASLMDTYAAIKTLAAGDRLVPIHVVVNMAPGAAAAGEIYRRLRRACLRFLEIEPRGTEYVPWQEEVALAGKRGETFVLAASGCAAARQIRRLSEAVGPGIRAGMMSERLAPASTPG